MKISLHKVVEKQQLQLGNEDFHYMFKSMNKVPRLTKVLAYLKEYPLKGKLLDIGCGDGSFAELLRRIGYDVWGIEVDKQLSNLAKKRGVKTIHGSFLKRFPFKSNFFDILFAGEVIEHTIDDDYFLHECFRVLKKGGLLVLTTPNLVSLGNRLRMFVGRLPTAYQPYHYRIYNVLLIKNKIGNARFKITKFSASHVLISHYLNTWFSKLFGGIGELLGSLFPNLGEQFIIYAQK